MRRKDFDLIALAAAYARERGIPLNHPELAGSFSEAAATRLRDALSDPLLLHGSRTQNLFEAMVVSLGEYRLFKPEDVGRVHSAERCAHRISESCCRTATRGSSR